MHLIDDATAAKSAIHNQTSNNLFNRPSYEQCSSFEDAKARAERMREMSEEITVDASDVQFHVTGTENDRKIIVVIDNTPLDPTNHFLSQVASETNVSMALQEKLTPDTLASALRETWDLTGKRRFLIAGGSKIRGFTGMKYHRLWDADITEALDQWLIPNGWVGAHPTSDTIPWVSAETEARSKPALFIGDRSSHLFLFSNEDRDDDGNRPGITINNSEVGYRAFDFSTFFFRGMCCNFLIWEPKEIRQARYRHTKGGIEEGFKHFIEELRTITHDIQPAFLEALEASKGIILTPEPKKADKAVLKRAERENEDPMLTTRKEHAVRILNRSTSLTVPQARRGVNAAFLPHNNENGAHDPFSAFALINGITDAAKEEQYQDNMVSMIEAGSSLLDLTLA